MLNPYTETIGPLGFFFAHCGIAADQGNRVYSVAAGIVRSDGARDTFESHVQYPYLTARERNRSGLSAETLAAAPSWRQVADRLGRFLDAVPVVFVYDDRECLQEMMQFSGKTRMIDLAFAAEFFLPQLAAHSPAGVREYLHGKPHRSIRFSAREMVGLSVDLVDHICGSLLNDQLHPEAVAIRYYLKKTQTLFGDALVHIATNYRRYFGGLFDPCTVGDTDAWKPFLERAKSIHRKERAPAPAHPISEGHVRTLFEALAAAAKGYRFRPEQVSYAGHVVDALNDRTVLAIEAGTGTGKTQGYLTPIMEYLYRNREARAVISTYTKSLQDQIVQREIALTRSVLKMYRDIPVAMLKGKSSYVCAEKLDHLYDEGWTGAPLLAWLYFVHLAYRFRDADMDDIGPKVRSMLGEGGDMIGMINEISAKDGCNLRHQSCPAQVITADAHRSRLVVTNHHKLALLDQDTLLAGLFNHYVIDEANHFESAVRAAFSIELRSGELSAAIDSLDRTGQRLGKRAGKDRARSLADAQTDIRAIRRVLTDFRQCLGRVGAKGGTGEMMTMPAEHPAYPDGRAKDVMVGLGRRLSALREVFEPFADTQPGPVRAGPNRAAGRLKIILSRLLEFEESLLGIAHSLGADDQVTAYRCFPKTFVLTAMPVDVSDQIREHFFDQKDTIVFTAATLSRNGSFDSFRKICGMDRGPEDGLAHRHPETFRFQRIASPFPVDAAQIVVPREAVSGKYVNKKAWLDTVSVLIPKLIRENSGRTLVLFSSYRDLAAVVDRVAETIDDMNVPLIVQQKGIATVSLCEEFRSVKESVLFGVDTFWYGVDFKGDTLTQVVITRIPYPSPMEPIQQARKQIFSPKDFWQRYHYETDIKLRQGMGRLIRSESDRGRVVILDSRFKAGKFSGPLQTESQKI